MQRIKYLNNSTKRYPRSAMQAWPKSVEYGAAIEVPYRTEAWYRDKALLCAAGCAILLVVLISI